jgi:hypothetical protein
MKAIEKRSRSDQEAIKKRSRSDQEAIKKRSRSDQEAIKQFPKYCITAKFLYVRNRTKQSDIGCALDCRPRR